jgi:nucleotide-binding universal stress UspA family protein
MIGYEQETIMFKNILVPLDGSELAAKIIPQVEDLAGLFNARVVLITIGSSSPVEVEEASGEKAKEAVAQLPAVQYLEETAGALRARGLNVTWVYKPGTPTREIITYATDHQFDLIALASHGAGEVAWVLGSVAEKVVSHATVPVLLIRVMETKPPVLKDELYYFSM